ncbi:hypothetical protein [Pandoraea terrae]|nr:hypothetical protein [Pandoraea terrae]
MASTFGKNSDALIFAVQPLNDGYIVFTRKSCPEPHDASGKSQDGGAEAIYFKYGGEIKQAGCWVPYADAAALKWADTDGTVTPMRAVQWANVFLSPDGKQYLLKKYGDKFRAMVQHENANRAW